MLCSVEMGLILGVGLRVEHALDRCGTALTHKYSCSGHFLHPGWFSAVSIPCLSEDFPPTHSPTHETCHFSVSDSLSHPRC